MIGDTTKLSSKTPAANLRRLNITTIVPLQINITISVIDFLAIFCYNSTMITPERDTLTTHEDIRTKFLSRRLGGSAALAEALEMRTIYADAFLSLSEEEHEKFIDTLVDDSELEDPLFEAETAFSDRVKEAFTSIAGYELDIVTPTSITLERGGMLPEDKPDVLNDTTRLIGELQEDGSFIARKERHVMLKTFHKSTRTTPVSPEERIALHIALNQLKEIDVMLELESDL